MIQTCKCGKEFLTEADPYALIPTGIGLLINCGCVFQKEIVSLKKELKTAKQIVVMVYQNDELSPFFHDEAAKWEKELENER